MNYYLCRSHLARYIVMIRTLGGSTPAARIGWFNRGYERRLPAINGLRQMARSSKNAIRKMPSGAGADLLLVGKRLYCSLAK